MKVGITRNHKPTKNDDGVPFEYTIHFRDAKGKLTSVSVTKNAKIKQIVDHIGEVLAETTMEETDAETMREHFLEEL